MRAFRIGAAVLVALFLLAGAAAAWLLFAEAPRGATETPTLGDFSASGTVSGPVRVAFLGNSNLLISDGATSIMTDGWFSRHDTFRMMTGKIAPQREAIGRALERAGVERLAAVIAVHSHFDHAMDSPEVARRTGALLVGSESTANIGRGWGLPEESIRVPAPGEPMRFGAFEVTMIESRHYVFPGQAAAEAAAIGDVIDKPLVPPVKWSEYKEGGSYSVLVRHPTGTLLIQGSAGYLEGALAGLDVDTLFLGVAGLGGQTEAYRDAYWTHVVEATKPEILVPIHWDSLTDPLGEAPKAPNRFWSDVVGFAIAAGLDDIARRAKDAGVILAMPELWVASPVFAAN